MQTGPSMPIRRLFSSLTIVGLLAVVPIACDDASKPKTVEEPAAAKQASNNMLDFVKKQQAEKAAPAKK